MRFLNASVLAMVLALAAGVVAGEPATHFHPKGKQPSTFTLELRNGLKAELPFEDKRDFDEAKKGFIAAPPYKQIMADAGNVAWDMESYQWLLSGQDFPSIHPSLQRQAVLNMNWGLFEVVPGRVYQVRGFDLANISFIKGDTGWIVFDPLTAKETARAALELINEKLGKRPVVGVVYSHSHVDHWAGVRGVVDEADVVSGKVALIADLNSDATIDASDVTAWHSLAANTELRASGLACAGSVPCPDPAVVMLRDGSTVTIPGVAPGQRQCAPRTKRPTNP